MSEAKCEACAVLEADVVDINNRLQTVEHNCARMKEAFIKNDLGLPDYDGHRTDHKQRVEETQVVEGYKRDMTKSILGMLLVFVAGLFSSGAADWLKSHIK